MTVAARTEAPTLDVDAVRRQFRALGGGGIFLDGPGGTQFPERVTAAIAAASAGPLSNDHGQFAASRRSEEFVASARRAIADIVGGDPAGVVLGPNMTTLTQRFAQTLQKTWSYGDNIVVSRLDHDANVRPWVQAAARAGIEVRWAGIDADRGELPADQYDGLVDARTRLVAVTGASNALGTMPDVPRITGIAHERGALTYVDGVHLTAHAPVDIAALGADFYACSAYKFCGPHVGAVTASPGLLARLDPDRLAPAATTPPDSFEWGTPAFELYAGVAETADFLADLAGPAAGAPRRSRILAAMRLVRDHETALADTLREGLAAIDGVQLFGQAPRRTPTVAFRLAGHAPAEIAADLGRHDIYAWDGDFYAYEVVRALGLADRGGLLRLGIAPYTDAADIRAVLDRVRHLAGAR